MKTITESQWNKTNAAHLLNRTCFAATPARLDWALARTPTQVVDELVDYEQFPETVEPPAWLEPDSDERPSNAEWRDLPPDERLKQRQAQRRLYQEQLRDLRAWWLDRMMDTVRPLQENLTLFWHGHFATSAVKVRFPYTIYLQNETLRRHAAGNWREMLVAVAEDPAMLIYLDNAQSRRQHPNENFARELMELFTLGEGHYTETDIQESARAFSGYTLEKERFAFIFRPFRHDPGKKTFMGRTGPLKGEDIIDQILQQDEAAPFITRKLCVYFMGHAPDEELAQRLAQILRDNQWDMRPLLKALFLSPAFYENTTIRAQIKSPVQWLVGTSLALERDLPAPLWCERTLRELGQDLFAPPNVKGWDGGYSWINTTTLTRRNVYAGQLVNGQTGRRGAVLFAPASSDSILPPDQRQTKEQARPALQWRFLQAPLREKDVRDLSAIIDEQLDQPANWTERQIRHIATQIMQLPAYQIT